MGLPELTDDGDLPPGLYQSTIEEVEARFACSSPTRRTLFGRLMRAYDLARSTGCLLRFVVFGSFVTAKTEPNDVDMFMIMSEDFSLDLLTEEQGVLFDHREADIRMGVSAFWLRLRSLFGTEDEALLFWQTKRGGGKRGIIEIVERTE